MGALISFLKVLTSQLLIHIVIICATFGNLFLALLKTLLKTVWTDTVILLVTKYIFKTNNNISDDSFLLKNMAILGKLGQPGHNMTPTPPLPPLNLHNCHSPLLLTASSQHNHCPCCARCFFQKYCLLNLQLSIKHFLLQFIPE